jgi:hypothetical protein
MKRKEIDMNVLIEKKVFLMGLLILGDKRDGDGCRGC